MSRLLVRYREAIAPELKEKLGIGSVHAVPKVTKVVLNMGVGGGAPDRRRSALRSSAGKRDRHKESRESALSGAALAAAADLTAITGQKAVITRARKSIANFNIREKYPVGARVTLRGIRMYEFMDRLINIALPRVHDFRGVSEKSFDGRGNYTLGLTDQSVFPEIDYAKIERIRGMNITLVTSAASDREAKALLRAFGMPFARRHS